MMTQHLHRWTGRAVVLLLALALPCSGWAADPESPVLASYTATGGLTPRGLGHQECRVRESGRFEWYLQEKDGTKGPDAKKDAPNGWFDTQLETAELEGLKKAIADTPFAGLKPNADAQRPSGTDGQDVTMTFRASATEHTLNLWQLENAGSLPAVASLTALREKHATHDGPQLKK